MKLKALFEDDGAVSPVIGVILMVAITVILAAVIGTFVLGLGDQMQSTSPTASITFDTSGEPDDNMELEISHDGGDPLEQDQISFVFENTDNDNGLDKDATDWSTDDDKITAGESITVTENGGDNSLDSGDVVKVVWTADGGDSSSVLAEFEVQ